MARGIEVEDRSELACQLILKQGDDLGLSRWAQDHLEVLQGSLEEGEGAGEQVGEP